MIDIACLTMMMMMMMIVSATRARLVKVSDRHSMSYKITAMMMMKMMMMIRLLIQCLLAECVG